MAKRNVSFIKPDEPAFLKRMKKDVGYKETCDINTKFDMPPNNDDESDRCDPDKDENPQVVVLKSGDLTKEEADAEEAKLQKEKDESKADLTQRIIFKPSKAKCETKAKTTKADKRNPYLLSFYEDEENLF